GGGAGDRTGDSQCAERNAWTIIAVIMATTIIADIDYRRWSRIIDCCRARLHRGGRCSGNCPDSDRTGDCDDDRTFHSLPTHDHILSFLRAVSRGGQIYRWSPLTQRGALLENEDERAKCRCSGSFAHSTGRGIVALMPLMAARSRSSSISCALEK